MAVSAEPPVEPGEIEVRAVVTLTTRGEVALRRNPSRHDAVDRLFVEQADELRRAERARHLIDDVSRSGSSSAAVMPLSFSRRAVTSTRVSSVPTAPL